MSQLASSVHVDLMPGESDPSNFSLPQQPLHPCLFPSSRTYSTFSCVTNPCKFVTDGVSMLGTSGQNIHDLLKYSHAPQTIDHLENTLRWRNLAPTAPDTLGCYPFDDDDPFVIQECPHVYFAANQSQFQTREIQGEEGQMVRLVLVPSFAHTQTIVLVNLNNLQVHPIQFSIDATHPSSLRA